jgi:hypothetical protein
MPNTVRTVADILALAKWPNSFGSWWNVGKPAAEVRIARIR